MRICSKCKKHKEKVQESHDYPKYIGGSDLDGRRLLCYECHIKYDLFLLKEYLNLLGCYIRFEDDWVEKMKWQSKLKKHNYLHPLFKYKTKEILTFYFNENYNKNGIEEEYIKHCISCGNEIDFEDYFFNNFCDKCFTSQDNHKNILE